MPDPTVTDLDPSSALDHNQLAVPDGVLATPGSADCRVTVDSGTLGASDTLSVEQGQVRLGGDLVGVQAQPASVPAATTDPRKDLVVATGNGSVSVVAGTPEVAQYSRLLDDADRVLEHAYRPTPPDATNTEGAVLAVVLVLPEANSIASGDVLDRRSMVQRERTDALESHIGSLNLGDESAIKGYSGALSVDGEGNLHATDTNTNLSDQAVLNIVTAESPLDVTAADAAQLGGVQPSGYSRSDHDHSGDSLGDNSPLASINTDALYVGGRQTWTPVEQSGQPDDTTYQFDVSPYKELSIDVFGDNTRSGGTSFKVTVDDVSEGYEYSDESGVQTTDAASWLLGSVGIYSSFSGTYRIANTSARNNRRFAIYGRGVASHSQASTLKSGSINENNFPGSGGRKTLSTMEITTSSNLGLRIWVFGR